jgi:ATP-dependent Clp protease adaptor protein ClpS
MIRLMETTTIQLPGIQTEKHRLKKPPMYKVIMLNDDYTPMDFVVELLCKYFDHSDETAHRLMMTIHLEGSAICGVYPKDIAETKIMRVEAYCRRHGHPLCCKCICEESEE